MRKEGTQRRRCLQLGSVFRQQHDLWLIPNGRRAQCPHEREKTLYLWPVARIGDREIQTQIGLALAREADGQARAQQARKGVAEDAAAMQLHGEIEAPPLHLAQEGQRARGDDRLVGDAGIAGELLEGIHILAAPDKLARERQPDQRDVCQR